MPNLIRPCLSIKVPSTGGRIFGAGPTEDQAGFAWVGL
jgi:hypothetical protein